MGKENEFARIVRQQAEYFAVPEESINFEKNKFYQLTLETLKSSLDIYPSMDNPNAERKKLLHTMDSLRPVIDHLTMPRSIDDFMLLRRDIFEAVYKTGHGDADDPSSELMSFLDYMLDNLGIVPYINLTQELRYGELTPDEAEEIFYAPINMRIRKPNEKIIGKNAHLEPLKRERWHLHGDRTPFVGVFDAKVRQGFHHEHAETLQRAKTALGPYGVLLVRITSKDSIKEIHGQDALEDVDRMRVMAANESVDAVKLMTPVEDGYDNNPNDYYDKDSAEIGPHFQFIGTSNYYLKEVLVERSKRLGIILLWNREKKGTSTTKILESIK